MSGSRTSRQLIPLTASLSDAHLSDAQFSDLMAGVSLESGAEAHFAGCSACRAEVEAVTGSVADFNALGMAWAEREVPRRVHTPSRWKLRLSAHPVWNAGLAASAAAVAFGIGVHLPRRPAPETPSLSAARTEGATPGGADLAADNRLLASIDQELSYTTQPSVPLSDLKDAGHQASANVGEAVAN